MALNYVSDELVGLALSGENYVYGLDGLVAAGQLRGANELREDLATEQSVVLQVLVGSFEDGERVSSIAGFPPSASALISVRPRRPQSRT
ncbi:hypothetical protein [Nocardia sp. NBC_00565]|uniref:hypothetical protein n=1 Tax=Nocardia sp. NBC_00565 TaxID=2975993 RepID=UPI002E7FFBB0|nr:hypothetical protein [Nocardia sp. NBC_00565]